MEPKFYICEHSGNIVTFVVDKELNLTCDISDIKELVPNSVDASVEKHTPVINVEGNKVVVEVGEVTHPMQDVHYIEWIVLQTKEGTQRKDLKPEQAPKAVFALTEGDEVIAAYAYCNLHGLWKAEK